MGPGISVSLLSPSSSLSGWLCEAASASGILSQGGLPCAHSTRDLTAFDPPSSFCPQEALESCQTRISKLELHQQEQQALQTDTVNAKVLLGKCINVILAFMTVILVCVSTIAKFVSPMMKSRFHILGTFFAVTLLAIFCKNWDHILCAIERIIIPR